MSLNTEWRSRVEAWIKALDQLVYVPATSVSLETFFTYDQLTADEAMCRAFSPIAPGTRWGAKWQYAWFRGQIPPPLPSIETNEHPVLHAGHPTPQFGGDIFGEWRIFIDGAEIGSRDWAHVFLKLKPDGDRQSAGSQTYNFLAEAFAGPTRAGAGGGPALHGIPTLPEPPPQQRVLPNVTVGLWREDIFQLAMDAKTLLDLRDQLPCDSLRVSEIDAGLRDFTLFADPELPWPQMRPSILRARERLAPLLACRNGSTAPTLFCIGHSHLDIVYQWPLKEAERKVARTFANQLGLMDQYPEYRYLQSMPVLYDIAKRLHPHIYSRVQDAVRRGQWIPEGGMWTEADTNLPGGESLIRQFLYGRRFFADEFAVESTFAWLPDTFGFTGSLPQIMRGCGITHFGSSKLFTVFAEEGDPFPYTTFWWEGIDGTRILSHLVPSYGIMTHPKAIAEQWKQNPQKDGIRARMAVYGHSDGGGGCERAHLEYLRRSADLEGLPRCQHATPAQFFEYQEKQPEPLPTFAGELYLPAHRGCYTTQSALKRGNRLCETRLREAELWSALAQYLTRRSASPCPYPRLLIEDAWKKTLFNQFHDILPGSCIERAAREARELYAESLNEATAIAEIALYAISSTDNLASRAGGPCCIGFNSLPWSRTECVALPSNIPSPLPPHRPTLRIGDTTYIETTVPSCGWAVLDTATVPTATPDVEPSGVTLTTSPDCFHLENTHYRIVLDSLGRITSWYDKTTERELAAGPLNDFRMYRDTPRVCDAWEVEPHYLQQPVDLPTPATIELLAHSPLAAVVRIRRRLHNSELDQELWLTRNSRRIEFRTRIRWDEKHKLLKAAFPLAITTHEALHEIQFGYLRRPTHRSRKADQDRFEVCQQKWTALAEENRGVALLNDCKHGISADRNTLALTLLRAPQAPDMTADIGDHEFTYALYAWDGPFIESRVTQAALELCTPLRIVRQTTTDGRPFAPAHSFFNCDAPNIILETVKLAEDDSGDLILRLYESARTTTRCCIHINIPGARIKSASETNMLELPRDTVADKSSSLETKSAAPAPGDEVHVDFRPFEIKTIRLQTG